MKRPNEFHHPKLPIGFQIVKERFFARIGLLKTPFEHSSQDCACSAAMCSRDSRVSPNVHHLNPSLRNEAPVIESDVHKSKLATVDDPQMDPGRAFL